MSTFTILYFAACSSYTSRSSESLPAPLPISKLYSVLEEKYTGITEKVLGSCLVTVNFEYVDITGGGGHSETEEEVVIQPGDEVAIIPPVSSG
ncbi:molybdopterin synthase small subunit CnxG [Tirmania nivea]|nr:molybdopterin synthase small subunit CnxG [Tirmania nivea]